VKRGTVLIVPLSQRGKKTMSLIDFHSTRDLEDFRRTANRLFGWNETDRTMTPAVDIVETDDDFIFELDLPGFTSDQIEINAASDSLTIKAERERNTEENVEGKFIRRERSAFKFARTFNFAKPINPDGAEVNLTNGVLNIKMPKSEEVKPKRLSITEAQ